MSGTVPALGHEPVALGAHRLLGADVRLVARPAEDARNVGRLEIDERPTADLQRPSVEHVAEAEVPTVHAIAALAHDGKTVARVSPNVTDVHFSLLVCCWFVLHNISSVMHGFAIDASFFSSIAEKGGVLLEWAA